MRRKLLILCLLMFVISMGCVCASEDVDNGTDIISMDEDESPEAISVDDAQDLSQSQDNDNSSEILTASIKDVSISAKNLKKYYGAPDKFNVTVKNSIGKAVSGMQVKININGQTYTRTTNTNGIASMAINLNSGSYKVQVTCSGKKLTKTITILPTIKGNNVVKIYKNDSQYYVECHDSEGNIMKACPIQFNINGVFYTRTTNENGVARMNINLNPGEYIITGKNFNTGEECSNKIIVKSSIIENHDLTKYYRNDSQYVIKILADNGKPASKGIPVDFNINGMLYTRNTDATGHVKLNINLQPGIYTITAKYNGLMQSNKITVRDIMSSNDLEMFYKDGSKYEVKLLNGKGKAYAKQTIKFNINGMFYDRTTDSNGIARLNINLNPGVYIVTATYNGLSHSNKVTIKSTNVEYDCYHGHKLTVPHTAEVSEDYSSDDKIKSYGVAYPDGSGVMTIQMDYSDYDRQSRDGAIDYLVDMGASKMGYYNSWAILNMNDLKDIYGQYTMWYGDGYMYTILSSDLNIAKRISEGFS